MIDRVEVVNYVQSLDETNIDRERSFPKNGDGRSIDGTPP